MVALLFLSAPMFFASTTLRLDEFIEIFFPVMVGEFGPCFNALAGKDEHFVMRSGGLAVRPTGVIDISGQIGADVPVDRFFCVHLEEVFAPVFFCFFLADDASGVFDDTDSFRDIFFGKKSLAGWGAAH